MRRISVLTTLILFLLAACVPSITQVPQPSQQPVDSQTSIPLLKPGPTALEETLPPQKTKGKTKTTFPTDQSSRGGQANNSGSKSRAVPTVANPDFIASEILVQPTNTSVTANIVTAVAMEIYYEYGKAPGAYTNQTPPQNALAGIPLETLIGGLQPGTRYYYRLRYNGVSGQERSFVTQRAPGSTFVFDIQGDSHPERLGQQFDADLYTRTLRSAATDLPDFYLTIGDDFSVDTLKTVNAETVRALYLNQRQWLGLVGAPVFLVNGNHEQASLTNLDGTANNVAVWAQTARNTYFPQPAPDSFYTGDEAPVDNIGLLRDYYAFTWGDALFLVIDPYWHSPQTVDNQFGADRQERGSRDLWNVTLGDQQYQWFKHTLETSTAKYKFVFTHHVLGTGRGGIEEANSYEWGDTAGLLTHRPGWTKTIQQLMADNHVTIFFQGHDHLFAYQELGNVIYQTLPEPANPNYTIENADSYHSGDRLPNSGHLRVRVSPDGVSVDYIRSYLDRPDEIAFSYTIR